MKVPFTGGCLCGTIRYKCSAEPIVMGNCHYRDRLVIMYRDLRQAIAA
ncbi:hypothetical protein [Nostoc sp. ChiSLP03a]|nr:hypothetical protein [Nostoc sp. ChiSLP03a]MDZ8213543.1 hypothetical protein [Nostoc sp. ChiSLP03a]